MTRVSQQSLYGPAGTDAIALAPISFAVSGVLTQPQPVLSVDEARKDEIKR